MTLRYARVDGKRRMTFVVEYADDQSIPRVHAEMEGFGGKVVAVQFSDALLELEERHDRDASPLSPEMVERIRESAVWLEDDERLQLVLHSRPLNNILQTLRDLLAELEAQK